MHLTQQAADKVIRQRLWTRLFTSNLGVLHLPQDPLLVLALRDHLWQVESGVRLGEERKAARKDPVRSGSVTYMDENTSPNFTGLLLHRLVAPFEDLFPAEFRV